MKRPSLVFLFPILFSFHLHAQRTLVMAGGDTLVVGHLSKGDSLYELGELEAAIVEYRQQYALTPALASYNLARAYARNYQRDSAFRYMEESIRYDSTAEAFTEPAFLLLRHDKRWKAFEDKLVAAIQASRPGTVKDVPLAKKLWELAAWDQAYFYEINIAERKIGMDSPVNQALWELKDKVNKENQRVLDSIIVKKGWPKISQVGKTAAHAAFLVIQHSNPALQQKHLPTIKKLCEQGEARWQDYALMYDRVQVFQNKPQRYGSQVRFNEATGQNELFPIEDEKNVNKRRAEVGLEPLEEYASYFGIKYVLPGK